MHRARCVGRGLSSQTFSAHPISACSTMLSEFCSFGFSWRPCCTSTIANRLGQKTQQVLSVQILLGLCNTPPYGEWATPLEYRGYYDLLSDEVGQSYEPGTIDEKQKLCTTI